MDPPSKKRSIFGFTGLFRSSPAPADDRDANKADRPIKTTAPAPAQREFNSASAPHSPVKRASESQLAARKIIGRPQGPSSKLSQSISASDISHLPSRTVAATPRRMPGDNPNKLPPSLSTSAVSHAPASNPKASSFSGVPPTPRNLFRSSALYSRPGLSTFSPRVPPNPLTQSFPPTTPGRAPRGSTADVNGRILANTTSSELFKMRIPSPPRHLTGEMLAREVPDDPNRPGSIYADEFLAHYCPPDFDEHQRRQFFCILDLRRLKYAADEVFTKKDWKINILNFAKEYEKSRSLIMLRYGLYEFKTVRPSEAVKKEWKQKHGIPDSDDESDFVPKTNGASKRKAEEGLTPSSSALTASASGGNKRARAPESPAKNKRKATAEPDENHPAKLQKPAPTSQKAPSATKSVFESIANKAQQDVSATPVPPAGKSSLFASSTGPKPNGSIGRSFLDVAPKPAATTGNIFDRLSDASKGSGNEGADEESETSSNAEEDQSEAQDVSQSDEQMASGGASTPRFAEAKKVTLNGTSSASSEAGESTQGRSLFERITRGVDGQPIRKLPPEDGGVFAGSASRARSASPTKDQPAVAPANNTWNENTPIKFKTPAPVFGSTTAVPAGSSAIDFGASKAEPIPVPAPPPAPAEAPKQLASQNLFGAVAKKTEEVSSTSGAPPKAAAPSAFPSFSAKTPDTAAAPGIFGAVKPSITAGPSLFGSAAPAFGQRKDEEVKKPEAAPAAAPSTIFEAKPAAAATEAPKPSIFQSTTSGLFANQSKAEPAPATQPQLGSLFAKPQTAETQAEKPAPSLFSAASAKPASSIFGAAPAAASTEEPAAKKFAFGNGENKSGSLFGSATSTAAPEPAKPAGMANIFAATSTPASGPATKSIFGSTPAAPATEAKGIFGTAAAPAAQGSKPVFGSTSGATETKPGGLFANPPAPAPAPSATPIFSFGSSQTPAASQQAPQPSGSIFGAGASTSFTFSAGGSDGTTIKNPFAADGSYSAPSSFNFGSGDTQPSTSPFGFGAGTAPTISFGGVPDSGGSAAQQTNAFGSTPGPIFNFGAAPQPSGPSLFQQNPPAASSIFGSSLAPGGGTSTGTNSPFTFGGASSLATTPAATTPEPSGNAEEGQGTNADGDEAPQEQISLTDGGPGEEDESVVHEVRAKAVKLVTGGDSDEESGSNADRDKKKKSPWKVQGIGPLRVLKHKTTGAVRMLLRAEPRGHVALNKAVLPDFTYKAEPSGSKYVKVTTASEDGKGLETWMLQVKTPAAAQALAECLEEHKKANKK